MESFANIRSITVPYVYFSNDVLKDVNDEFINLTGFTMAELVGKSVTEIENMIKLNLSTYFNDDNNRYSAVIFTKFLEIREVNISFFHDKEKNRKTYMFVEKLNSRLEERFMFLEQMYKENESNIAIYSVSDLRLLKANKSYINFMNLFFGEYGNIIGKSLREIRSKAMKRRIDSILENVYKRKKTVNIKELKLRNFNYGIGYWDFTVTPIFEERNNIKYLIVTGIEVTDRVSRSLNIEKQRRIIEKQKEELEQKNSQLKTILENLSEGVILSDNKGKIIMMNKEAERLIYPNDKFNSLSITSGHIKLYDMEGKEISENELLSLKALKGETIKNHKIMIRKYGKEYYIDNSVTPIYSEAGKLTMVVSCFHDITETILKSKRIQEQKEELNAIIENVSEGISIFDGSGKYKLFNKAAREMFFNNEQAFGDIIKVYNSNGEKVSKEDYPSRRVIAGEKFKNIDLTVEHLNKKFKIGVSGTPIFNENGEFLLGINCFKDITNYYEQKEILKNRNEFLDRLIYNLEIPVVGFACKDLKVLKINQKAFNLIKKIIPEVTTIEKVKGNKITDILVDFEKSDHFKKINEVIQEKKTKYLRKKKRNIDGKEVYYRYIFEPIFESNGELKEILILAIDITSEIKSNIIMERTLRSQEEFFVNISHELKTPLNVIFATSQLIDMYCNDSSLEEKKECIIKYIELIKQNSYRLSKLINNIVDLSKIEAGFFELKLANKNIVEVVEEIVISVTDFIQIKGLNITFDTNTEEKIIACDSEKIERIILNLLSNAIKFSDKSDGIFVEVKDKEDSVEISVKDNGIGIEPSDLDKIFDRFKQVDKSLSRNSEGTGIGLSLVKSFVELHGGCIKVESEFGEGSRFIINLPSKRVSTDDILCHSNIRNRNEIIQVEFSDVYA